MFDVEARVPTLSTYVRAPRPVIALAKARFGVRLSLVTGLDSARREPHQPTRHRRTVVTRWLTALAFAVLVSAACSNPKCGEGFKKIATVCVPVDAGSHAEGGAPEGAHEDDDDDARDSGALDGIRGWGADAMFEDVHTEPLADSGSAVALAQDGSFVAEGPTGSNDAGNGSNDDAGSALLDSSTACSPQSWYCDNDGDGFAANAIGRQESCPMPPPSISCKTWTRTAPIGMDSQDCDDTTALRFPGAGFGLATSSSGDLNCDGVTETRLEFVASPFRQYSSMTPLNICMHFVDEVLGGTAGGECGCWFSTALGSGFIGFMDGMPQFAELDAGSRSSPYAGGAYFANTFPCAEEEGDVIFLSHAVPFEGKCETAESGGIVAHQLCR